MDRVRTLPIATALVGALAAACSAGTPAAHRPEPTPATGLASRPVGGAMDGGFSETARRGPATGGSRSGSGMSGEVAGAAPLVAGAGTGDGAGGGSGSSVQVGLRAGSVDDNARFADYLTYRAAFAGEHIRSLDYDVSERHVFTVTTPNGAPVLGADIAIVDGQGAKVSELRTYADGRALWFPKTTDVGDAQRFSAVVTAGGATTTVDFDRSSLQHDVVLDAAPAAATPRLDLEFLVDATGSMGDEIDQLKASLADIVTRIEALPAHPDVRFALTIFRDHGDAFLTRTWNFSADVESFQADIAGVRADGGGDFPEDVQQGLHDALVKPTWREPGTVKLVFLIGDAPPHLNYQDDPSYVESITAAAQSGIKIESLAASGLDDQGEFVWRQLAQATLGQFLFLTYGADDHTPHHVSGYSADNLADVVVRTVDGELSPLTPPPNFVQD